MNYLARIFIAISLFLLALFIAPLVIGEKGYVLIALGHWTVELSFISLCFTIIALSIALYFVVKILLIGTRSASQLSSWLSSKANRAKDNNFYNLTSSYARL